jgi:hypothetical protein
VKLKAEETHTVKVEKGKNRCVKCKKVEPDLTKPCPKASFQPAGATRM